MKKLFIDPKLSGKAIILVATLASPLIFLGRGIVDEVINLILAFYLIFILVKKKSLKNFSLSKIKIEFIFIVFLILNSIISFVSFYSLDDLRGFNYSTLRLLALYSCFFVFLISLKSIDQNNFNLKKYIIFLFNLNLIIYFLYWVVLIILGINWESQQASSYAGSKYAAFTPIIGLFFILKYTPKEKYLSLRNNFIYYLSLCLLVSYLFKSRLLFISILLVIFFVIKRTPYKKNKLMVIFAVIFLALTQNIFTIMESSTYKPPSTSQVDFISVEKIRNILDSVTFLTNPRISDVDVKNEIVCSYSIVINSSNLANLVFGYGTSSHKSLLYECYGESRLTPGAPVRPVGINAFMLDYGLFGVVLGFILLIKLVFISIFKFRSIEFLLIYIFCVGQLFIVNTLDHSLLWCILFLRYFEKLENDRLISS